MFENNVWLPDVAYVYVPSGGEPDGEDTGTRVDEEDELVPPVPLAVRACVVGDEDRPEPTTDTGVATSAVVVVTRPAGTPDPDPDPVADVEPPADDPGTGERVDGVGVPVPVR